MRYIKITYYKNNITIKVIKTNLKVIEAKEVWVIMFKDILKKEGQLKSNRDWKEKNKRYLENLQKENEEKLNGVNTLVNEVKKESQDVIADNRKKTYLIISFAIVTSLSVIILMNFQRNFRRKQQETEEIEKELFLRTKRSNGA